MIPNRTDILVRNNYFLRVFNSLDPNSGDFQGYYISKHSTNGAKQWDYTTDLRDYSYKEFLCNVEISSDTLICYSFEMFDLPTIGFPDIIFGFAPGFLKIRKLNINTGELLETTDNRSVQHVDTLHVSSGGLYYDIIAYENSNQFLTKLDYNLFDTKLTLSEMQSDGRISDQRSFYLIDNIPTDIQYVLKIAGSKFIDDKTYLITYLYDRNDFDNFAKVLLTSISNDIENISKFDITSYFNEFTGISLINSLGYSNEIILQCRKESENGNNHYEIVIINQEGELIEHIESIISNDENYITNMSATKSGKDYIISAFDRKNYTLDFIIIDSLSQNFKVKKLQLTDLNHWLIPTSIRIFKDQILLNARHTKYTGTSLSGNWNRTIAIDTNFLVSTFEVPNEIKISIFPNPSNDVLFVKNIGSFPLNYKIYNLEGKLQKLGIYDHNNGIKISDLLPNCYILMVNTTDTNQSYIFKIIKI